MAHTVRVHDKCIGVGVCASIAPEVFVLNDGVRAAARMDTLPDALLDSAGEAAESCPMAAIEIRESP